MKVNVEGAISTYCDFCKCSDEHATLVDQGEVAICQECVTKCFLILMSQLNKPNVQVDENKNAIAQDNKAT